VLLILDFSPIDAGFVFGCGTAALVLLIRDFSPIDADFVFGCGAAALVLLVAGIVVYYLIT